MKNPTWNFETERWHCPDHGDFGPGPDEELCPKCVAAMSFDERMDLAREMSLELRHDAVHQLTSNMGGAA